MESHKKQLNSKKVLILKQEKSAKRKGLLAEKNAFKEQIRKGLISDDISEDLIKDIDEKLDSI